MTGTTKTGNTATGAESAGPRPNELFSLLVATSQQLTVKYPKKYGAYERVAQLAEETGEVAEQINIWAGTGLKRQKHGEFNPHNLALELADVMRVAVGIALEFGIVNSLVEQIRTRHAQVAEEATDRE